MNLVDNKSSSSESDDSCNKSFSVPKVGSPVRKSNEITAKDLDLYKDFYEARYKTKLELSKISNVIINNDDPILVNFPLVNDITHTGQLYNIRTQVEGYLKSLDKEIKKREQPQLECRERIDEIKHLIEWFDITFTDYNTNKLNNNSDNKINYDKSNSKLLEKLP